MKSLNLQAMAWAALACLATACSSNPTKTASPAQPKEDAAAAARSQVYMASVEFVTPEQVDEVKSCSVPPAAEKFVPNQNAKGPSKEWKALLAHAAGCVRAKDWKTLESLGNAMARMDLDSPWGAYFLALAAEGSGEYPRALWMIDLAQKKAGGRSGLYAYEKGRIYLALKETTRAMREIEAALSIEPKLVDGQVFLGQIYQRDQENDKAIARYQAALEIDAKNYRALAGLGEMKLQKGESDAAAEFFKRAVAADPSHLETWLKLASLYETQKNDVQALNTYKGLRASVERGQVKERVSIDLNGKIKALEESTKPRVPAQANAAPVQAKTPKSVK